MQVRTDFKSAAVRQDFLGALQLGLNLVATLGPDRYREEAGGLKVRLTREALDGGGGLNLFTECDRLVARAFYQGNFELLENGSSPILPSSILMAFFSSEFSRDVRSRDLSPASLAMYYSALCVMGQSGFSAVSGCSLDALIPVSGIWLDLSPDSPGEIALQRLLLEDPLTKGVLEDYRIRAYNSGDCYPETVDRRKLVAQEDFFEMVDLTTLHSREGGSHPLFVRTVEDFLEAGVGLRVVETLLGHGSRLVQVAHYLEKKYKEGSGLNDPQRKRLDQVWGMIEAIAKDFLLRKHMSCSIRNNDKLNKGVPFQGLFEFYVNKPECVRLQSLFPDLVAFPKPDERLTSQGDKNVHVRAALWLGSVSHWELCRERDFVGECLEFLDLSCLASALEEGASDKESIALLNALGCLADGAMVRYGNSSLNGKKQAEARAVLQALSPGVLWRYPASGRVDFIKKAIRYGNEVATQFVFQKADESLEGFIALLDYFNRERVRTGGRGLELRWMNGDALPITDPEVIQWVVLLADELGLWDIPGEEGNRYRKFLNEKIDYENARIEGLEPSDRDLAFAYLKTPARQRTLMMMSGSGAWRGSLIDAAAKGSQAVRDCLEEMPWAVSIVPNFEEIHGLARCASFSATARRTLGKLQQEMNLTWCIAALRLGKIGEMDTEILPTLAIYNHPLWQRVGRAWHDIQSSQLR